jgi:uncharacterized membrane protein
MKKKIRIITLIMAISALFTSKVQSQIYLENHTNEPVWVVLTMYYGKKNFKAWHSDGWYKVEPNEKKLISSAIGLDSDFIYYYAHTSGKTKEYKGEQPFLVDPVNAFNIRNADLEYVKNENPKYEWRYFRKVDMNTKLLQLKYTIHLFD